MRAVSRSISTMMERCRCGSCRWPSTPTCRPISACWKPCRVPEDFHARYAAHAKTYAYRIRSGAVDDPFDSDFTYRVAAPLDLAAMRRAAAGFVGTHDFLALCASGSSVAARGDTVRTVSACTVTAADGVYTLTVTADGYLYNMVRILAGTVLQAGRGRLDPAAVPAILQSRDRSRAGPTLPACGLCLLRVDYD